MTKRTARQIRIDAMEEVRRKDAAAKVHRPNRPALERMPTKRAKQVERVPQDLCCMIKHNGTLPNYFRPCVDCPNNEAT